MIDISNQLVYFAFFQGLFLLVIFGVSHKKRQQINIYVLILVVLLMLGLVTKIGHFAYGWERQLKGISEFSILFFGPTIYLFVQSTLSEKRFSNSDLFHYIPGVVYSLIVTFYYILPPREVITERVNSGELFRVVHILVGLGLTVNITYFTLSILKYYQLKKTLQSEASYVLNISFVKTFLVIIGICLSIWLVLYLISFGDYSQIEIASREFIWLTVALIVLFVAYYQMVTPSVFQFHQLSNKIKYAQSQFSNADLDELKQELEEIMEQKKPYLNAKLLKSELAELMNINAPELSRLLNERIGMSFFEYVNYHRIHEFIRLAKSPVAAQKTLLGLAQEAGFHSKSTFNKSFKQIMGCPPSEFLRKEN
ncbi:helix-turn-helix domain-containing protein [Flavobacteriaceae bacterium M23B6Z8]